MKNIKKIFLFLIIILGLTGCSSNLKKISYSDLQQMIKENKTFILEVSQDGCSHCEQYSPIIKQVLKDNNLTAYNLNITYISKKDYNKFNEKYNFEGTPTTMFFKNGKEILSSRLVGSVSSSKLTKVLERLDYIKK